MLRVSTPQLSARPRPRSGCVELMGDLLRRISARTRTRSVAYMLDTYMRTTPTLILLDGGPSQDTWAAHWLAEAIKARPRPTRDSATRHPCRQAAFFLPCASRPPDVCRLRLVRPRLHHGARHSRAFLTTSSGFDTMTRRRQDATDDKITEADDTAGDATFGGAPHQWPKAGHTSFYA
jgi:hypothetical protein